MCLVTFVCASLVLRYNKVKQAGLSRALTTYTYTTRWAEMVMMCTWVLVCASGAHMYRTQRKHGGSETSRPPESQAQVKTPVLEPHVGTPTRKFTSGRACRCGPGVPSRPCAPHVHKRARLTMQRNVPVHSLRQTACEPEQAPGIPVS